MDREEKSQPKISATSGQAAALKNFGSDKCLCQDRFKSDLDDYLSKPPPVEWTPGCGSRLWADNPTPAKFYPRALSIGFKSPRPGFGQDGQNKAQAGRLRHPRRGDTASRKTSGRRGRASEASGSRASWRTACSGSWSGRGDTAEGGLTLSRRRSY